MKEKIIAIDGPSGAGKSSITKNLAKQLDLIHIDSGALYRTVALRASQLFSPSEEINIQTVVADLKSSLFKYKPTEKILVELNGQDVSLAIRENIISKIASKLSSNPEVRNWVNDKLREIVNNSTKICVMEGRDIGSVIFPNALLKIFLTASSEKRAQRRFNELKEMNALNQLSLKEIKEDIEKRDLADSTRAIAPLICAPDAIKIDTSDLSFSEVLDKILLLVKKSLDN